MRNAPRFLTLLQAKYGPSSNPKRKTAKGKPSNKKRNGMPNSKGIGKEFRCNSLDLTDQSRFPLITLNEEVGNRKRFLFRKLKVWHRGIPSIKSRL
jgi:hypothetical protein